MKNSIRQTLGDKGVTQATLADRAKIRALTVARMIKGETEPGLSAALRVA